MGLDFVGLPLAQVLAVLGAAGAAVTVLYLLKLRRRVVPVPFVKLWEEVLAEKQTTRLFSWLKRLLSLLVALLVVALLAFALGDPRAAGARASGRTLVLLIDASASMQATDVAPTRLAEARRRATEIVDALGAQDRALVAQMDATTTPLSPMTDETRVLRAAIAQTEAVDVGASLPRGLRFALDVLRDQPGAEIVVLSDGQLGEARDEDGTVDLGDTRLSYVKIGARHRNVGITAFSVRRYPLDKSRSEVLVELHNTSDGDEQIELQLLGDGEPIDVQRISIARGERLARFFENVSGADRTLEARLSLADGTRDDLPVDDRAYARLPERRRARVLSVSPGNLYLEAALLLDEYLDVTEITPSQYQNGESRYDVVIFDGFVPSEPPRAHAIWLNPLPATGVDGPLEITGTMPRPQFDRIDRRQPLLRFTALDHVNVAEALVVRLAPGDRAVVSDPRGPLIVTGAREGKRFVALTFDVRRSDLALRVAWPILLLNAIDGFVEEDAQYLSSYATGDTWRIAVPAGTTGARILAPDGTERDVPLEEGRAVYAGQHAGFHTLRTIGGPSAGDVVFAANLGAPDEGELGPAATLSVGDRRAGRVSDGRVGVRRELWIYLVAAVALVLALEWLTYHRRWTV